MEIYFHKEKKMEKYISKFPINMIIGNILPL